MKRIAFCLIMSLVLGACNSGEEADQQEEKLEPKRTETGTSQTTINNEKIKGYSFLDCMYDDAYFPKAQVDKCKQILWDLCLEIEIRKPSNKEELYDLTNSATIRINDLQNEFAENGSEIETVARECLAEEFEFIASTYGFDDADVEEMIAEREW